MLVSSHVLSEVEQTVDDVVVIHRGRLVKSGSIASLITATGVRVRSPKAAELAAALERDGAEVRADGTLLVVPGRTTDEVGDLASPSARRCTSSPWRPPRSRRSSSS